MKFRKAERKAVAGVLKIIESAEKILEKKEV